MDFGLEYRIRQYMVERVTTEACTANAATGASTSTALVIPITQAVQDPEENDPTYRAYAFLVQAPRGA